MAGLLALALQQPTQAQLPDQQVHAAVAALPDAPLPQAANGQPHAQDDITVHNSLHMFVEDEKGIWTSPARLRPHDAVWLAPFVAAAGAAFATDHRAMSQVVSHDTSFNNQNITVSNALVGGVLAAPVVLFADGQFRNDDHARQTGILGGEAIVDGLVVSQVFKLVSYRERPNVDQSRGRFFQQSAGYDGSFFSMHTTLAFSAATVVASEVHSPWLQVAAYAGASAVGVTRILGQEHFPSDVLIGATTGWLIGHYVVKHHHPAHR